MPPKTAAVAIFLLVVVVSASCRPAGETAAAEIPLPPREPIPLRAAEGLDVAAAEAHGIQKALRDSWQEILLLSGEENPGQELELTPHSFDFLADWAASPADSEKLAFILHREAEEAPYSIAGYVSSGDRRVHFLRLLPGTAHTLTWAPASSKIAYIVSKGGDGLFCGLYIDDTDGSQSGTGVDEAQLQFMQLAAKAESLTWDDGDAAAVQLRTEEGQPLLGQLRLNASERPLFILREGIEGPTEVWDLSDDRLLFTSKEVVEELTARWNHLTEGMDTAPLGRQLMPECFQTVITAHYAEGCGRMAVFLRGPYLAAVDLSGLAVFDCTSRMLSAVAVGLPGLPDGAPVWCPEHRRLAYTLADATGPHSNLVVADSSGGAFEVFGEFREVFARAGIQHREDLQFGRIRWQEDEILTFNLEWDDSVFDARLNLATHTLDITAKTQ